MTAVNFWVDTDEVGDIGRLNEDLIENLLTGIVELIGNDASFDANTVVKVFSDYVVEGTSEPPDT